VAHHADDQAETFVMRLQRGSGPDGLAAMAPVRELHACRLLRPLLGFQKDRLLAVLRASAVDWIEDPSNFDPKYARSGVRAQLSASDADIMGIGQAARRFARARAALENHTSDWMARYAVLDPAGYLALDHAAFQTMDDEIRLRVLSRAALAIGGKTYPLSIASLERLAQGLAEGRGATLGSARFHMKTGMIHVYREARNLPEPLPLSPGVMHWDGRFVITRRAGDDGRSDRMTVKPWSLEIDQAWPKSTRPDWLCGLPAAARFSLPVICTDDVMQVPKPGQDENIGISVRFQPTIPMSGGGFTVA